MFNLPSGHKYTPAHTPYHVAQLSVALLKATLHTAGDDNYPFRYDPDFKLSGVAVDTIYNREAKLIGKKPTVVVSRGPINASPISMGDHAQPDHPRPRSIKSTLVNSSVDYRIIGRTYSECDILSNEIFNFITSCRTLFPKIFNIHQVSNTALSPVMQAEHDDQTYVSSASFSYLMQYRWVHIDVERLISSIHIFLNGDEVYNSLQDET